MKTKTIKQIADEIGVSKQAVFYRIKKEPLSNDLEPFISKIDGVLSVSLDGETLIKAAFSESAAKAFDGKKPPSTDKEPSKENGGFDGQILKDTIDTLREQLNVKDKQLAAKDEQILSQAETIKNLSESINTDRKQGLASTIIDGQKFITDGETPPPKKQGFFSKFFGSNANG